MKNIKIILSAAFIFATSFLQAQVSVNVNLGTPPVWGPVVTTEEYYFLPDINSYYDIRQSQFIYLNNGVWIRNKALPRRYRSYNLNTGYVMVLNDYKGRNPYSNYKSHKVKYFKGNSYKVQKSSSKNENHDNGNSRSSGKSKGKGNKKDK
jgi:hypothetical protein